MKLKRSLLLSFILLIAMTLAVCLTACDSSTNTDGGHTHSFGAWQTTEEATCSSIGTQKHVCTCGYTEYRYIEELPHTEVIVDAIPATCTESGRTEGKHCGVCNEILQNSTAIEPLQHSYDNGAIISNATCLANGVKRFTCTRTNCDVYYDEYFPLQEYTATEIYNQALNYVGEIITYDKKGLPLAQGTGFVISEDGNIITNFHVIEGAYSASITIAEDTYIIQSILAYDADIDLAILKINATGLTPAIICKNEPVIASEVYAIGSPEGFTASVSVGNVSYSQRVIDGVTYVQHTAAITHGSSGSPLINKYGEVIGVNAGAFYGEINVAIFTGELDNLSYITPISLADFYDSQNTPNDILTAWLIENYNYISDDFIYHQIEGDGFIYAIACDITSNTNFIEGYWEFADGSELYLSIDLIQNNDGLYPYYAHYSFEENENYTRGYIDPDTYTVATILTHYSYNGDYWDEESLMEFYSSAALGVMEWFDYCLANYVEDIEIEDFYFESLVFEYNTGALSVLKAHIGNYGKYDSANSWYRIDDEYEYATYDVKFSLVYDSGDNSAFASMTWFGTDGTYFYTYLSLSPMMGGYYYGCSYSVYSGGTFIDKNSTNGYIEAGTFTTKSKLTYMSYDGLLEDKEELLSIYSSCLQDLLNWMGAYFDAADFNFGLADLGYIFYDGYYPVQDCDGENHYYQSPTFSWVEDENGFNVTATFVCGCGTYTDTATTYVSNTDYVVTTNATETQITYAFTATIVFNGYTYTDTRYIKYEYQTITLHNSNYKDYIGVGCHNSSYIVSTSVSKKFDNLTYTNVTVTFTVRMTGTANNGAGGMGYSKTVYIESGFGQKHTNVSSIGLDGYMFYPSSLTYSVAVTGQVSGYIMTEYLIS